MTASARRHLLCAAAAALGLAWPLAVAAQVVEEEEVIFGRREKPPILSFEPLRPYAQFRARYENSVIETQGGEKTESTENLFREILGAETRGHIISPRIVDLSLAGSFGLSQSDLSGNTGQTGSSDGQIYEYNVSALTFGQEKAPLTLYTRRAVELVNRPFGASLESTQDTYGADWNIRSRAVPTTFRLYHIDQQQVELSGERDFAYAQDAFEWHSEATTENQRLNWDYTFNSISQSSADSATPSLDQTSTFDSHAANLVHALSFGPRNRHTLVSSLGYSTQTGDFSQESLRADEMLTLQHTDRFETRYQYLYNQTSFGDIDQQHQRATAAFRHRLYGSLTTNGRVGLSELSQREAVSTSEQFADLTLDYNKRVPLGTLAANFSAAYNLQQNEERGEPILILNERHVFEDLLPLMIRRRGIVPGSVVVTDARGIRVFNRGGDYLVLPFPDHLELRRQLTGRIPEDTPVLVDYQLEPESANEIATTGFGFGLRYNFQRGPLTGVSPYGRYFQQDQTVSGDGAGGFRPDNIRDTTFGIEYRIWQFVLTAEQQTHDSTLAPFDSTRYGAHFSHQLTRDLSVGANAFLVTIDYPETDNHVELQTLSGRIEYQITRRLYGTATATWHTSQDSLSGTTEGLEETVGLFWRHRQTDVFLNFRNATLETDSQESSFQFVEIGITRRF